MSGDHPSWTILFAAALGTALLVGCAENQQNSRKMAVSAASSDPDTLVTDEPIEDEREPASFGGTTGKATTAAWVAKTPKWSIPGAPQTGRTKPVVSADAVEEPTKDSAPPVTTNNSAGPQSAREDDRRWSVTLMTFSGEDNEELAEAACIQLRRRYPLLAQAFVQNRASGSVILVGRFTGLDDPDARPFLKQVQTLTDENARPFARSLLARVATARESQMGAFDLRRARQANPNARSLYSMEVAVWSDFGSDEITLDQIRSRAEAFTKKLRAQGYPAFFNHDDDRRMSIVTIGLFGEDAYNSKTMLYSDGVEEIKRKFPKLLVNDEELRRPIRKGSQETTPDASFLVEVPR